MMLLSKALNEYHGKSQPLRSATIILLCLLLTLSVIPWQSALGNRTPSTTVQDGAQTGPITKNYPGSLTVTMSRTGTAVVISDASAALNSVGAVTSAQLTPAIAATTNATVFDVSANGCTLSAGRCANRGTVTLAFNKPVTNPVLHVSGLGGNQGATLQYHASLILSSWVAAGTPTLTRTNGTTNFAVSGNEIRVTTVNGGTTCTTAPLAGCGSVRINGTVSSVTFQVDMLTAGTGTPTAANLDSITLSASVDEDFGDAPAAMESAGPASHVIGDLYLGSSITTDNVGTTNGGTQASPNPSATASLDGGDDGVTIPVLARGTTAIIPVAVTGSGGFLQGWIDWADDGSFATAGDRIATNAVDGGAGDTDGVVNGVITLSVPVPASAALTQTIARFRLSSTNGLNFTGLAPDGEVEDYAVTAIQQQADLSLTKTVNNPTPNNGSTISYTLTLTNAAASQLTASGITVTDLLPSGTSFVSASGPGTYTSGTGVWSVSSLAPGASAVLTINATVTATAGTVSNIAQVTASSAFDGDSTPNNGVTTEDDYASAAFTVATAMAAPTCAVGSAQQIVANGTFSTGTGPSWPSWTASSVWTGTTTALVNDNTTSGSLSQSGLSGLKFGPGPSDGAVIQLSQWWRNGNPAGSSTSAQLTITVGGTPYARINTPAGSGTSASVTYLNGASGNLSSVTEFVTTGWRINLPTSVAASGAISFDFVPGGGTSDDFEVDNITLYTCPPGDLSITKVSSVLSDGTNPTNPKSIPGAVVRYCILVSNIGAGPANTVSTTDTLPATVTYIPGSMFTGTSCTATNAAEDDDATGGDENDPFGMSISGTTITGTTALLGPADTFAMAFNVTVN